MQSCSLKMHSLQKFASIHASFHKGYSQNAVLLSLTATLLLQSGALLSPHRIHALQAYDT